MSVPGRHRRRLGFTVMEVMTALMVLSVLARIGIQAYQGAARRSEAAQVVADFDMVRQALSRYRANSDDWPRDYGPGIVPPELKPYLGGLGFHRRHYRLDWQNWPLPHGLPGRPAVRGVLALSVETEDRALGAAFTRLLEPDWKHFIIGDTYTFVLTLD